MDFIILSLTNGRNIILNKRHVVTIDSSYSNYVEVIDSLGRVFVCNKMPKGIFIDVSV